jgi:hypothetical protein
VFQFEAISKGDFIIRLAIEFLLFVPVIVVVSAQTIKPIAIGSDTRCVKGGVGFPEE